MPELTPQPVPSHRFHAGATSLALVFLLGVAGVCIVAPLGRIAVDVAGHWLQGLVNTGLPSPNEPALSSMGLDLSLLGSSLLYAALIGGTAVCLGFPTGLALGRVSTRWSLAVVASMVLPTFLAYAGWSIVRSPTTPMGRWLGSAPERGMDWLPGMVSKLLAVGSLGLWAWPLAAVVIGAGVRTLGQPFFDHLALDTTSHIRRVWTTLVAIRLHLVQAWSLVALIMLGSAVPLHVAQIQTYAIVIWRTLDAHPETPWQAWISAWPLVFIASVAAWLIIKLIFHAASQHDGRSSATASQTQTRSAGPDFHLPGLMAAWLGWVLGVGVPMMLFLWSMGSSRALVRFVNNAHAAIGDSTMVAGVVAATSVLICLASAQIASTTRLDVGEKRQVWKAGFMQLLLMAWLIWSLLPGVLVGAAVAGLMRQPIIPESIEQSIIPMVLAHVGRFGSVPMLVGLWVGTTGLGGSVVDLRLLDAPDTVRNWILTTLPLHIGPALAVGLACFGLSLQEIEASVMVQQPGLDHLAQRLLQWLHYERMEELSAAATFLTGVGIMVGLAIVSLDWLGSLGTHRTPRE